MASQDKILRQLSGLSLETWETCCPRNFSAANSPQTTTNHQEDSGYESPSSKTEENQAPRQMKVADNSKWSKPSRIPVSRSTGTVRRPSDRPLSVIHPVTQPHVTCDQNQPISFSEEAFLRTAARGQSLHVKTQDSPAEKYSSLPTSNRAQSVPAFSRYNVPERDSNQNEVTMRKLVPPHFSIPPPSPSRLPSGQFPATSPTQLPSMSSMIKGSDSLKAMLDTNVLEIVEDGEKDFSGKYSAWIQQVFNLQLDKVHSKLRTAYTEKLTQALDDNKKEVLQIKSAYRQKLVEFEAATKHFLEWYDDVLEESRRQAEAHQELVSHLMDKEAKLQRDHENQLQAQLILVQAEAERERARDLEKHADQLKQVTEKSEAQNELLEAQHRHQVELLKEQIKSIQNTNATLQLKLAELKKTQVEVGTASGDDELTAANEVTNEANGQFHSEVEVLRMRIAEMEEDKKRVATMHAEETEKLYKTLDGNNQKLRELIQETRMNAMATRAERERNTREMQAAILGKEAEYKRRLSALTQRYGQKIEELTKSVEFLQTQLLTQTDSE